MRSLVGIMAAAVIASVFVLPADARAKKPKRPAAVQAQQASPSLDGRILGRLRTCDLTIFNMTVWARPTVPIAIDARVTVGDAAWWPPCAYGDCGNCSPSVSFAQGLPQSGYPGRRRC
jgi:hypothetical protein